MKKRVWFITGAGRGMGAEIARAALEAGDEVVATARDSRAVEMALGRSERLLAVPLDVTKPGAAEGAVKTGVAHFGSIDVLVNNAGYALYGAVEEITEEELRRVFDTNFFGMVALIRAALPVLRAQKRGHIFNFSSVAGFRGDPGASAYVASKFAVEGMSEALAGELAPLGIKVTIIEPGLFRTEFLTDGSSKFAAMVMPDYDATAGYVRRLMKEWNGTQANDPRKLAKALVTLVSSEQPPLRFTAGADAVEWLEENLAAKRMELDRWRALSASFDLEASGQDASGKRSELHFGSKAKA